jgi:hypothetical protein
MGLRPTNRNEGAAGGSREINSLERVFNRAVLTLSNDPALLARFARGQLSSAFGTLGEVHDFAAHSL